MFKSILKTCVMTVLLASAAAHADPVVFDRGLPAANLNNAAGSDRSNVAWGFGENKPAYYAGDNFTLGAGNWNISTLRVWAVIGRTNSPLSIADRYSSIALYGGAGSTLNQLMAGGTTGNSSTNADISITKVQYPGALDYQNTGGSFSNIYEIEFTNLNWLVTGGTMNFSVAGVSTGNDFQPFFMHASNAAKGGVTADGADDFYAAYFQDGINLTFDSLIDSSVDGWDKSSDINVQIEASAVPEPASMALFGVALAGFGLTRRQRGAKR